VPPRIRRLYYRLLDPPPSRTYEWLEIYLKDDGGVSLGVI
jgi:hypothetical protein